MHLAVHICSPHFVSSPVTGYVTGYGVENFPNDNMNTIHCSPLTRHDSHLIVEVYGIGQA